MPLCMYLSQVRILKAREVYFLHTSGVFLVGVSKSRMIAIEVSNVCRSKLSCGGVCDAEAPCVYRRS